MLTTTKALVLTTHRYGESRRIVCMYTQLRGMQTFAYTLPRRGGAKATCLQPLTLVDLSYDHRPAASMQTLKDVRLAYAATTIPFDAYKLSIALFLAEFLRYALRGEQHNAPLFDYLWQSIVWLDTAAAHYANFHIVFLLRLSAFVGIAPNVSTYSPGAWFDLSEGIFSATRPPAAAAVAPAAAQILPTLLRLTFRTMRYVRLSRTARNSITEMIITYYSLHLPAFPALRSFAVLKELFT